MKASEVIQELQKIINEKGDLLVIGQDYYGEAQQVLTYIAFDKKEYINIV